MEVTEPESAEHEMDSFLEQQESSLSIDTNDQTSQNTRAGLELEQAMLKEICRLLPTQCPPTNLSDQSAPCSAPDLPQTPSLYGLLDGLLEHARPAQKAIEVRLERWKFDLQRLFNWCPDESMPDFSLDLAEPENLTLRNFPFASELSLMLRNISNEYASTSSFIMIDLFRQNA